MFGELPAWGLYIRHAEAVVLNDIKLNYLKSDKRMAGVFNDIAGLALTHFIVWKSEIYPTVLFRSVTDSVIKDLVLPDDGKAAVQVNKY